jgi:phosphoenolpyruvate synthase/pyruvate phosphate dikinase
MGSYVLDFPEIDRTQVAVVGGKGAHLGELSRIGGIRVPAGFCVTTDAFQRIMAEAPTIDDPLDRLSRLEPDDREAIRALSAEIRRTLEAIAIPTTWRRRSPARSPGSASRPPTPSDPARRRRTCRRPPSPASRTPT